MECSYSTSDAIQQQSEMKAHRRFYEIHMRTDKHLKFVIVVIVVLGITLFCNANAILFFKLFLALVPFVSSPLIFTQSDGNGIKSTDKEEPYEVCFSLIKEENSNICFLHMSLSKDNNTSIMRDLVKCNEGDLKHAHLPVTNEDIITVSLSTYSRIRIKPFECCVHFTSVSAHHPSEVNGIPWKSMNQEWWRLHTFSKYPRNAPCSSILLAKQGFIYIGSGHPDDDTILCVFCISAARNLDSTTNVQELHRTLNPGCPFVRNSPCGNMPMKEWNKKYTFHIFSQLLSQNHEIDNSPALNEEKQYEGQSLPIEADSPPLYVQKDEGNTTSQDLPDDTSGLENLTASLPSTPAATSDASSLERSLSNDTENTLYASNSSRSYYQDSGDSGSYFIVTNLAQSLSLPFATSSDSTDSSNNVGEAADTATTGPDATTSTSASPAAQSATAQSSSEARPVENSNRLTPSSGNSNVNTPTPSQITADTSRSSQGVDYVEGGSNSSHSQAPTTAADGSPSSNSQTTTDTNSQNPNSYENLGIITTRPKRTEYAVEVTRLQSFDGWPQDHHIKPVDLAQAGYFYTGYSDCARCFYCGGGLRNWEDGDDVWVEHARWFPKCAFMRQSVGQSFIDVVQDLNKEREMIPFDDVVIEMRIRGLENAIPKDVKDKSAELERDAAVKTIIESGFTLADAIGAAENLKETGQLLAADALYEELVIRQAKRIPKTTKTAGNSKSIRRKKSKKQDRATIESLKSENSQLRQQSQCKICMDKEVSVVFLPCGHYISCNECSFALKGCPVCRENIKGVVRAHLS